MGTFTYTYAPIFFVIQSGGSINLVSLTEKLQSMSQRHFPDMEKVERAINSFSACLQIVEGDRVVFNRKAKSYAHSSFVEREVDFLLHENLPDIARFELYPHRNPKNSKECPMGIPWEHIPKNLEAERVGRDPYILCDYQGRERSCRYGCEVKKDIINRFNVSKS